MKVFVEDSCGPLVPSLCDLWVYSQRFLCSLRLIIFARIYSFKCEITNFNVLFHSSVSGYTTDNMYSKQMAQRKIPNRMALPLGWSPSEDL